MAKSHRKATARQAVSLSAHRVSLQIMYLRSPDIEDTCTDAVCAPGASDTHVSRFIKCANNKKNMAEEAVLMSEMSYRLRKKPELGDGYLALIGYQSEVLKQLPGKLPALPAAKWQLLTYGGAVEAENGLTFRPVAWQVLHSERIAAVFDCNVMRGPRPFSRPSASAAPVTTTPA